ncbi:thiamine biosynthesis protein ThiS [Seleniivibrio woodruffii]|uniref:Sulfur carrier protein n=1 Tax=Seleniivibrio woodruffii TaxID=1078050 RepID=A0A4V2PRZ2_9BACT|nr:thiamine biosynthesis protein ThiS [Seleniivibrio woodruffii]TCK60611.1 sulfur carrier protein [Seleniivibrio woodruffii]TVZ36240.1 sulfur carrier protein [Seleniivibrio woodruffii]
MVTVEFPDGTVRQSEKSRIKDILKDIGQNENAVLVVVDDCLVTSDVWVKKDTRIKLISVVSGG